MKPTLADRELSAKACGHRAFEKNGEVWILVDDSEPYPFDVNKEWNPPENPAQNWECVEELLRRGWHLEMNPKHCYLMQADRTWSAVKFVCDAKDFACLALAKLQREGK